MAGRRQGQDGGAGALAGSTSLAGPAGVSFARQAASMNDAPTRLTLAALDRASSLARCRPTRAAPITQEDDGHVADRQAPTASDAVRS
jgi:hypothetical protein